MPATPAGIVNSVIGSAAGSWLSGGADSDLFSGSGPDILMKSSLDKGQQELWDNFMPWFNQYLQGQNYQLKPWGATDPYQKGDAYSFVAPLTDRQQVGVGMGNEVAAGSQPYLDNIRNASQEAMKGITPEDASRMYNENVVPYQRRLFQEEVLPGVKEAYAQTGTFSGSNRADAEANAYGKYGEQLGMGLQDFIKYGMESGRAGLQAAMNVESSGLPYKAADRQLQYGELERQLQQQEITARFEEYKRTDPALSPLIDRILQVISTSTQMGYGTPGKPGILGQLLSAGVQGGMTALPALIA